MALILHFLIVQNFCEYFTHEMRLTKRHQSQHKIQETIATATFGTVTAAQQSKYLKVSNNSIKHLDETLATSARGIVVLWKMLEMCKWNFDERCQG